MDEAEGSIFSIGRVVREAAIAERLSGVGGAESWTMSNAKGLWLDLDAARIGERSEPRRGEG